MCCRFTGGKKILFASLSFDGNRLAFGNNNNLRLRDISKENQITELVHQQEVLSVAFSPDGLRVVSGCRDGTVQIWEVARGEALKVLQGDNKWVML